MPPISHKYINKLRREVAAFDEWLANTQPQPDGSANVADLQVIFTRANSIYLKALALYRTTGDGDETTGEEEPGEATLSGS